MLLAQAALLTCFMIAGGMSHLLVLVLDHSHRGAARGGGNGRGQACDERLNLAGGEGI
jgi:hypothetical protein